MSQNAVIAVDASILGRIMSGVGVYVENVLRYLDMPGVDFHLFSDVPLEPIRIPGRECEVVPLPFTSQVPGHNLLGPFWTHYLLPRAIKRQGIPLLWSPNSMFPGPRARPWPPFMTPIQSNQGQEYPPCGGLNSCACSLAALTGPLISLSFAAHCRCPGHSLWDTRRPYYRHLPRRCTGVQHSSRSAEGREAACRPWSGRSLPSFRREPRRPQERDHPCPRLLAVAPGVAAGLQAAHRRSRRFR